MVSQMADYEVTTTVVDDAVLPCLQARKPPRLGGDGAPVTIWALGPVARTSWASAWARLQPVTSVRSPYLPQWLEAGVAEWDHRPVVWVSASTHVIGTLASPPAQMSVAVKLRAIATAARGTHVLHEHGQLHGAISPYAIALVAGPSMTLSPATWTGSPLAEEHGVSAVLAPPSLANGARPLAHIGYPPLGFLDPQLLRGEAGRWSDIWALGATARHAVTGSAPFPGIEDLPVVQALAQLLTVPAPAPVELPPAVAPIINACLSADPASRPYTAAEVADRLDEAAAK